MLFTNPYNMLESLKKTYKILEKVKLEKVLTDVKALKDR